MYEISLFVEDFGHEEVIKAIIKRFASEYEIEVKVISRNVRGGKGKAITEFKEYLRDWQRGQVLQSALLIVAIDANCKGIARCERELKSVTENFSAIKDLIIYAIPDPHIERWLLLDSGAFKNVLGKGCAAPDLKCNRARYKKLLLDAIRDAGVAPLLGGMEYAEDIIQAMDLERMKSKDESLGKLVKDLNSKFKEWSQE